MPFDNVTTSSVEHDTNTQPVKDKRPASGLEVRDFEENTRLITEASLGNEEGVRALLKRGAHPDAQNIYGYTALLTALAKGYSAIADILLDFGANVHISSLEGLSPLHLAAMYCDEALVSRIIECGAFLGAQDDEGDSVLHWAVRESRQSMLVFLLNKACHTIELKNEDGETPLHLAAALGDEAIVELLVKSGANVDAKDNEGRTAADNARDNAHYVVAHSLNKGKKTVNSSLRHDPYRRSCGEVHERKFMMSQRLSTELPPPAHYC